MPTRISSILNVSEIDLDKEGVFNSFIDIDSQLYVDPSLLEKIDIIEFQKSYENFKKHFANILTIIKGIRKPRDIYWKEAVKRLQFKEFKYVGLGYAIGGKKGNGIGAKLATDLLTTAKQIADDGINDPVIFELIGLIQENISLDRISDMTIHIIRKDLITYTENVCVKLKIPTKKFGEYNLPFNPTTNEAIVFLPKKILRHIPIAYCWEDIDMVCFQSDHLKQSANHIIGKSWREVVKGGKNYLRDILLNNTEAFADLIKQYKSKPREEYDFENDPIGEIVWAELSEKAGKEFPIDFKKKGVSEITTENIFEVVNIICKQYAKLIESNGWFEFLYDKEGNLRNERFAQKLFYGIADVYCRANDLNLSREPNAGSGALDFKLTKGYNEVVTVELKYSSNPNLIKGFLKQLPTYNKAENAQKSVYLILRVKDSITSINNLKFESQKLIDDGAENVPEIIVIDGRKQISASKK